MNAVAVKLLAAVVSFIFPPVGVLIRRGVCGHLFVNIGLTLMLWLPGLLHALYLCVVDEATDPDAAPHAEPIVDPNAK